MLVGWEGLDAAVAARVAGCSLATFRVRLHRARRRLAKALEDNAGPDDPAQPTTKETAATKQTATTEQTAGTKQTATTKQTAAAAGSKAPPPPAAGWSPRPRGRRARPARPASRGSGR
jgi:hypothetical protein